MNAQGGCVYGRQSDPYKKALLESDSESLSISTQIEACRKKAREKGCRDH